MQTIPPYDEQALLRKLSEGDESSFRKLVHQYSDLLGSHIYRLTHDREQTEEIVQDIFLKIWETRESLTEVRNFKTYLYVISRNQALNAIRSLIRERNRRKKWEQTVSQGSEAEETITEEQISLMDKAIAELPEQQQKAWLLSRREGLKYKEIADLMNLSPETVKKYIKYASQAITRYMETHIGILLLGILLSQN